MVGKKYSISQEGMDKLMKRLTKIATQELSEEESEDPTGLREAEITTDFVKMLTKVKGMDDVISRNDKLSKHFKGFLDMYGFETMYDMYLYAMSCEVLPSELKKSKDFSNLVPVKRTITRNGKQVEVTIWEKPGEGDESKEGEGSEEIEGRVVRRRRHAREFSVNVTGDTTNPKEIAEIKVAAKDMPRGNKPFQDGSTYYLAIRDEDGTIVGVIGYSEEGGYLKMDFHRSNGEVSGVAARGFFELLKLGSEKGLGVKMEDDPQARPIFMQSGLEQKEDFWVIESDKLKGLLYMEGSS